jgi:membrane-bound serine protease (ClpP class)
LHREKAVGIEAMVGLQGRVVESLRPAGLIMVKGEYWKAMSVDGNIETDMPVEVVEVEGLALRVKRIT